MKNSPALYQLFIYALFTSILVAGPFFVIAQTATHQLNNKLIQIENNTALSENEKLQQVLHLQKIYSNKGFQKDSVYARILYWASVLQFYIGNPNEAISNTQQIIPIITKLKDASNTKLLIECFYNLGYYHAAINRFQEALDYYDNCIQTTKHVRDSVLLSFAINARLAKGHIYFQTGDYQKAIEEATLGLQTASIINNASIKVNLLTDRAQAYSELKQTNAAFKDLQDVWQMIDKEDLDAQANYYKIKAWVTEASANYKEAVNLYKRAIACRSKTENNITLASDYLDAGNTLRKEALHNSSNNFAAAKSYYLKSLQLAEEGGDYTAAAKAQNNLAAISFRNKQFKNALWQYHNTLLQTVSTFNNTDVLSNPILNQCNIVGDKNFLSLLLGNKTECMLQLYKQTRQPSYLYAALKTAMLTDSVITEMRHEQTGEQSKLYWLTVTREFFNNAIEASFIANNAKLAFYFMEKSRAVLLNDKLNELGSFAYLPAVEADKEKKLQIATLAAQQQLLKYEQDSNEFKEQQIKLLKAKEEFYQYIKSLEKKYPAYYQYKYADDVPPLHRLQKYLQNNNQSFVHYYVNDTAVYMLAVLPDSTKLVKASKAKFNEVLSQYIKFCSDKASLNNNYPSFAALSYNIYQTLFQPLSLPKGRVIICYDNLLIPFEGLSSQSNGRAFLIKQYAFSYIYSARFLLKQFNNPPGVGNFLGVAPVAFASHLKVPALLQSQNFLTGSANYYHQTQLYTRAEANRGTILKQLPNYTIACIYSHAKADSTDEEPMLYLADSAIRLSELQLLHNPSTQLMILSACQTNVGKTVAGEGIFSLARGFAAAGIPSVAATLWKADEKAIYNITGLFHQHIAAGMRIDDALQKAKLTYMDKGSNENLLPYYWANLIIAGKGESIKLTQQQITEWWIAFIAVILGSTLVCAKAIKQTRVV